MTPDQLQQYLAHRGLYCPFCDHAELEAKNPESATPEIIVQEVTCPNCKGKWEDRYWLVGARVLAVGEAT